MTGRKIVIAYCGQCPHKDHNGGFGKIAYIPVCKKKNRKILPYKCSVSDSGFVTAQLKNGIPDWCPLPKNK